MKEEWGDHDTVLPSGPYMAPFGKGRSQSRMPTAPFGKGQGRGQSYDQDQPRMPTAPFGNGLPHPPTASYGQGMQRQPHVSYGLVGMQHQPPVSYGKGRGRGQQPRPVTASYEDQRWDSCWMTDPSDAPPYSPRSYQSSDFGSDFGSDQHSVQRSVSGGYPCLPCDSRKVYTEDEMKQHQWGQVCRNKAGWFETNCRKKKCYRAHVGKYVCPGGYGIVQGMHEVTPESRNDSECGSECGSERGSERGSDRGSERGSERGPCR